VFLHRAFFMGSILLLAGGFATVPPLSRFLAGFLPWATPRLGRVVHGPFKPPP
jgi:hypothetical protein